MFFSRQTGRFDHLSNSGHESVTKWAFSQVKGGFGAASTHGVMDSPALRAAYASGSLSRSPRRALRR